MSSQESSQGELQQPVLEAGEDVVGPAKLSGLPVNPDFQHIPQIPRSYGQNFPDVKKSKVIANGVPLARASAKDLGVVSNFVPVEGSNKRKRSGGRRKTKRRRKTRRRGKKNSRKRYYRK
jgi:hypothetical protein